MLTKLLENQKLNLLRTIDEIGIGLGNFLVAEQDKKLSVFVSLEKNSAFYHSRDQRILDFCKGFLTPKKNYV